MRDEDKTNLKTTLGMHTGNKYIRNDDGSNSSMRQPKYAAYISVITQPTVWCMVYLQYKILSHIWHLESEFQDGKDMHFVH